MNHSEALTEQVFSFASELYAYGVREVVISPGSRSTPLALVFEAHPNIKTWIHPDERSAAFFALGLIKGSEKPVAILCTSGTAAANYTPAIAESQISRLPLVVLTSDRPHELRSVGAPQAINQVNMFSNYVNFQFDLPIADGSEHTIDTINYQMQIASQYLYGPHRGPIHFNLPFREPLTPDLDRVDLLTSVTKTLPHYQKSISVDDIKDILQEKNGLIIVGDMQHQAVDQILTYSTIYDLPILADPLSQLRKEKHPNVITTYDLLYRAGLNLEVDYVIRVGKPVISKKLNQWLKKTDAYQTRIEISDYLKHATDEAAYVGSLIQKLTKEDTLFVGNSMPIRDVDNLLFDSEASVYANRGANGIDGVVSTALGMAAHKNVTLLIGDLSFYHDMNGLLMAKLNELHINIVLVNNNGGGIFSYLPQKRSATKYFERLFGTPTGLNFEYTALLYDFTFKRFDNLTDFKYAELSKMGSHMYEVITNRDENLHQHQNLYQKLSEIVNVTL